MLKKAKKYKYYFKKPRTEIAKDIFKCLAIAGVICFAASSPYFVRNILRNFSKWKKYPKKKLVNTFYQFKKQGLINIETKSRQIYISLTEKGKAKAGWLQIDELKIKQPRRWDKKWRLITFDIAQLKKFHREAFRGKLKQLGFYPLQKSIWIYPFDCSPEIEVLRKFFDLSENEMRLILAEDIGDDLKVKNFFELT